MYQKQFIDDIHIKGALTGILLRSPVVSGILKEIQTPKLPQNVSLVTAKDIPGLNSCGQNNESESQNNGQTGQMHDFFDISIFPEKELSWYGQPVAMLLGPDPVKLQELASQCLVLAEELPEKPEKQAIIERNSSIGTITDAFEKAETVVKGRYITAIEDPWPSDPPGAIAIPGPGKTMTIYTATQNPGHVRSSVAQCLNIKNTLVKVEAARLEYHLDSKVWYPSLLACQAAIGGQLRNKPVTLILNREEDFLFSPKSAGTEIFIESALDKQGSILGTKVTINADFGAFGIYSREIIDRIALSVLGAYNHGSVLIERRLWKSNIPPAGPITGFGLTQGFFAAERHASRIAETTGIDGAQWRKTNLLSSKKTLAQGKNSHFFEELITKTEIMSDFRRKWSAYELLRKSRAEHPLAEHLPGEPLRGIGISIAFEEPFLLQKQGARDPQSARNWGCAVVEAEINPVSYIPRVRGIWLCLEGIPKEKAKLSTTSACMTALSWAMQEQVFYENGIIDKMSFKNYPVLIEDYPPVYFDSLVSKHKNRDIEALPFALIPAAYAEALSQALDRPFEHYPVNSEDIWKVIHTLPKEEQL